MGGLVIIKLIFHLVGKSNNTSNLQIHPVCIQYAAMLFNAFKYLLAHTGLNMYITLFYYGKACLFISSTEQHAVHGHVPCTSPHSI